MNSADILVLSLVIISVIAAIFVIIKNKKKSSGCCGDCVSYAGCKTKKHICK